MRLLLTGGCGFIGSNAIHQQMAKLNSTDSLLNIDALTYAANVQNVEVFENDSRYIFEEADIRTSWLINDIVEDFSPTHVIHFAAESHVDRSLSSGAIFFQTNVEGTFNLLEACRNFAPNLKKFIHISTDEVLGSIALGSTDESYPLYPRNPYSASKAGAEHVVNAFRETYNFPAVITRCTNNYGRFQHPEKFIPNSITRLLKGQPINLYGRGSQVREWTHVLDHCDAIDKVMRGDTQHPIYHVTGGFEISNYELARMLCTHVGVDPDKNIDFVEDRVGHDQRYSLSSRYITDLGYVPTHNFIKGIDETIEFYRNQE